MSVHGGGGGEIVERRGARSASKQFSASEYFIMVSVFSRTVSFLSYMMFLKVLFSVVYYLIRCLAVI